MICSERPIPHIATGSRLGALVLPMLCVSVALTGCVPIPDGFDSPVPGRRIDASVRAASEQDTSAIPHLITMLDSDDPASRLIAHNALESIVGRPVEFDHGAPWPMRRASVERLRDDHQAGRLTPSAPAIPPEAARPTGTASISDPPGGTDG